MPGTSALPHLLRTHQAQVLSESGDPERPVGPAWARGAVISHDDARLLVVDDVDASRFIKAQMLRRAGFTVAEARTGAEALAYVKAMRPDLVVLDVNLPDMSGLDVCQRVKADPSTPGTQVLHVSQTAVSEADRARGLDVGADMYLVEPFGATVFIATVRALLRVRCAEAELERALVAEREARDEAQRANRMKDEFLAMVSHELRTPLNAMTGWIWQLKRGALDADVYQRAIDVLDRNARIQVQLINDLLDVSRISTGKLEIRLEPTDLRQVVESAAAAAADSPFHRRKRVTLEVHAESAMVQGDASRLHQVVTNVLNNAYQFTPSGGKVAVTAVPLGSQAIIQITDTGAGIAAEFLPHVFERFGQERSRATSREPGLGLGLAIVRDLVERHRGGVRIESPGLGLGTTVTITLPLLEEAAPRDASDAPVGNASLQGLRLLVVEDDPDAREVLQAILARYGASVTAAEAAAQAEALVGDGRFDVLISDIGLPGVSGTDFIRRLRAGGQSIPAVAVTAFATDLDRKRLLGEGFVAHVAKPVDPQKLVNAVFSAARAVDAR